VGLSGAFGLIETQVQRFYRLQAPIYNVTRWAFLRGRKTAIASLGIEPDSSVLEIGCGTGSNFRNVAAKLDKRHGRLVGVDFSEPMLRRARFRVAREGWPNVRLVVADAAALPFREPFDRIYFSYSLAMMPEWENVIDRVVELLAPSGRLVVLDFGRFQRWGPAGPLIRSYLRANHVETERPMLQRLQRRFGHVETQHWLGGYNFVAVASHPTA